MLHPVDCVEKLGQTFQGVVFTLERDQQCISRGEHVLAARGGMARAAEAARPIAVKARVTMQMAIC